MNASAACPDWHFSSCPKCSFDAVDGAFVDLKGSRQILGAQFAMALQPSAMASKRSVRFMAGMIVQAPGTCYGCSPSYLCAFVIPTGLHVVFVRAIRVRLSL